MGNRNDANLVALMDHTERVPHHRIDFELARVLEADAVAKSFFDGLSYSNQRRLVLNIEGTKNPETRARRIAKSIETLRVGKMQ